MERSTRTVSASFLLIAALFIGMNNIVASSPLGNWTLPLVLAVIGAVLIFYRERERVASEITTFEGEIGDTQQRMDALAAAVVPQAEELEEAVDNISTATNATLDESDEIAGPPMESQPRTEAARVETPVEQSVKITQPVEQPIAQNPAVTISKPTSPSATHEEQIGDTESRSDALATVAEPSAEELEDTVENISTDSKSTLEETGELSGPPTDSRLKSDEMPAVTPFMVAKAVAQADDLTVIEGIGPKMSAALIAAGIDTFAKLAVADETILRAAISAAGMRFAPSLTTWPQQASYAARGDWDGLKKLTDTLTAGRKNS